MSKLLAALAEQHMFQMFDDSDAKDRSLARNLYADGSDPKVSALLREYNNKGAGVFFTVNQTNGLGRKRDDIVRARAVWIDDDGQGITMPAFAPTFTVQTSPGKQHLYWIFTEPTEDLERWQKLQQTMVDRFGSDPGTKDVARVLRVPGYWHMKGDPCYVEEEETGPSYSFEVLCKEFGLDNTSNASATADDGTEHALNDMVRGILDGSSYHPAARGIAAHFGKKAYPAFFSESVLRALLQMSETPNDSRRRRRDVVLGEVPSLVSTGIKTAITPEFAERSETENYGSTEIPMPPGRLGDVARCVMEHMRFPNKEIAIVTALHAVSVFAGRRYAFLGKGLTTKRVLLAEQGTGKNTTNKFMQHVVQRLMQPNEVGMPRLTEAYHFMTSADYTAVRPIHLQLEEFATRSMILPEAGHAQRSEGGDKSGLQSYILQLLSRSSDEAIIPKNYSIKKGEGGSLQHVYNPCAVVLHESVPSNYSEVIRDGDEMRNGSMARADLVHVKIRRSEVKKNRKHSLARIPDDLLDFFASLAQHALKGVPTNGTSPFPSESFIETQFASPQVEALFDQFDDWVDEQVDKAESDVDRTKYVRKVEKFLINAQILAICDDWKEPKLTAEHVEWVKAYQKACEITLDELAGSGALSSNDAQALSALEDRILKTLRVPGRVYEQFMPWSLEVSIKHQLVSKRVLALLMQKNSAFNAYAKMVARGNMSHALNLALRELTSQGVIREVTPQMREDMGLLGAAGSANGKVYQYMFKVEM